MYVYILPEGPSNSDEQSHALLQKKYIPGSRGVKLRSRGELL